MSNNKKRIILKEEGRNLLKELRLSNKNIDFFNKNHATINKWESGKSNPSYDLFEKYLKHFNLNLDNFKNRNLIQEIALSAQEIATNKATKIKKNQHNLIIQDYNFGLTLEKISKKHNCTPSAIFYILKKYSIDTSKHGSGERYKFPESEYIESIINKNIFSEEALPLISSLLFTDGCLYEHKKGFEISYYGTDPELHRIFADLIWYCFKIRPSSYMIKCGSVLRTKYINKHVAKTMLNLSPSYKTKPSPKEDWKDFLEYSKKPTLSFMKNYSDKVVKEFIRLAMCADGCISVSDKKNKIFFTLILACSHPALVKEWSDLFNRVNIKNNIVKGSGKTNIGGVKGIEDCLHKFYEIGGFINNVGVCVKHSPLYRIEKQKILINAIILLDKHKRINTLPVSFNEFKSLL